MNCKLQMVNDKSPGECVQARSTQHHLRRPQSRPRVSPEHNQDDNRGLPKHEE